MRANIYERLQNEFKIYDSLIDVGCGELHDLVCFEYSKFIKLIGIEKDFYTNGFGAYHRYKTNGIKLTPDEDRVCRSKNLQLFMERFTIHNRAFIALDFPPLVYSFIICNKVLHFYNDKMKQELIEMFYVSLQKSGMMYLKINHNKHPNNTDLNDVIKLGENIYQPKASLQDTRYLIDPAKFLSDICEKYNVLQDFTEIDERTLTLVIRK